jgi:putative flippase GtrA
MADAFARISLQRFKKLFGFFWGSLAGVAVDLIVFQSVVHIGVEAGFANVVSSGLAIVVTYFSVTRYVFLAKSNARKFAFFFGYYTLSITFFSIIIGFAVRLNGWPPLAWKILSLPLSFAVNFLFSNLILGKK